MPYFVAAEGQRGGNVCICDTAGFPSGAVLIGGSANFYWDWQKMLLDVSQKKPEVKGQRSKTAEVRPGGASKLAMLTETVVSHIIWQTACTPPLL